METFWVSGRRIELPATPRAQLHSSRPGAWETGWTTVEVTSSFTALRVHTNGRKLGTRDASSAEGAWLLIGDIVKTSSEIVGGRALPGGFTHISRADVPVGTFLNIGFCGKVAEFEGEGGDAQAEFVGGPWIKFTPMPDRTWVNYSGNA